MTAVVAQAVLEAASGLKARTAHTRSVWLQVSVDDPEVKQAAEFAAAQLQQRSNSLSPMKLEEVGPWLCCCADLSC